MAAKYYVGIDLGGMSAKAGLFDAAGKLIVKDTVKTSKEDGYTATVSKLAGLVKKVCEKGNAALSSLCGVGVGSPGIINGKDGVVLSWTNFGWENKSLAADLSRELNGLNVKISNDANAAALGEAKFGAGKNFSDSVLLTLGTGVGSGIILGGKYLAY